MRRVLLWSVIISYSICFSKILFVARYNRVFIISRWETARHILLHRTCWLVFFFTPEPPSHSFSSLFVPSCACGDHVSASLSFRPELLFADSLIALRHVGIACMKMGLKSIPAVERWRRRERNETSEWKVCPSATSFHPGSIQDTERSGRWDKFLRRMCKVCLLL